MAFCGKCGQKNPEGALFCSACGARLNVVDDAAPQDNNNEGTRVNPWLKMAADRKREAPRREPQQPRQEEGLNQRSQRYEQPRRNRGFEKPVKKGGTFGGCMKKLLLWIVVLFVGLILLLWAVDSCTGNGKGGNNGGGSNGGSQTSTESILPSGYEPLLDKETLKSIAIRREFSVTSADNPVQLGTYSAEINGHKISLVLQPYSGDNSKILAKAQTLTDGKEAGGAFCAYCGNSIYGLYGAENLSNDNREYFFAHEDGKTLSIYIGGQLLDLKLE